jgi:hypothetical protein
VRHLTILSPKKDPGVHFYATETSHWDSRIPVYSDMKARVSAEMSFWRQNAGLSDDDMASFTRYRDRTSKDDSSYCLCFKLLHLVLPQLRTLDLRGIFPDPYTRACICAMSMTCRNSKIQCSNVQEVTLHHSSETTLQTLAGLAYLPKLRKLTCYGMDWDADDTLNFWEIGREWQEETNDNIWEFQEFGLSEQGPASLTEIAFKDCSLKPEQLATFIRHYPKLRHCHYSESARWQDDGQIKWFSECWCHHLPPRDEARRYGLQIKSQAAILDATSTEPPSPLRVNDWQLAAGYTTVGGSVAWSYVSLIRPDEAKASRHALAFQTSEKPVDLKEWWIAQRSRFLRLLEGERYNLRSRYDANPREIDVVLTDGSSRGPCSAKRWLKRKWFGDEDGEEDSGCKSVGTTPRHIHLPVCLGLMEYCSWLLYWYLLWRATPGDTYLQKCLELMDCCERLLSCLWLLSYLD